MELKEDEDLLEKSGCSYLENSQYLYPDLLNQTSDLDVQIFQYHLQNYHKINQPLNYNQIHHFEYIGQINEESIKQEENKTKNNDTTDKISQLADNFINDVLFNYIFLQDKEINNKLLKEFTKNIEVKKENKFLTKSSYVGFVNNCGENSCYVNVVLHLLNNIIDVKNILKDIAKIEKIKKYNLIEIPKSNDENNNISEEEVLSNIGDILNIYDYYTEKTDKKQSVTNLNTFQLRKNLDEYSNHNFKFDTMSDPIELLLFILDILNKHYKQQIHNNFYLNLIDQNNCPKQCKCSMKVRFDKDNFCYHIYVNELLNFIKDEGKRFKEINQNLFDLSLDLYKNEIKICEKCSVLYEKYLVCYTIPKYLLINLVWNASHPEQKDILDFLFLLSVEEDLKRLFICDNSKENTIYNLLGMILYSYSLCHYTVILYNKKNKVFVLHDDKIIIEYKTLFDCFSFILIDNIDIYDNNKAFFYPTMLLYTNETIYNKNDVKLNELNEFKFVQMLNKIEECQNKYNKKHS